MRNWIKMLKDSRMVKGFVYALVGIISFPGITIINRLQIKGMDKLKKLPESNVLFVSNHQTYFAEVITFLHIFCAVHRGKKKSLGIPFYLFWPYTHVNYVSAEETMKKNWLSRLFSLAGAIMVKRTWVKGSKKERRGLDPSDTRKILRALEDNWVITFPQGTTTPFAPGRKGTAYIIKSLKPVVVPVVIDGFSKAFDKKGIRIKEKGTTLTVNFKDPLPIDYNAEPEEILAQVMDAIEQSEHYKTTQFN